MMKVQKWLSGGALTLALGVLALSTAQAGGRLERRIVAFSPSTPLSERMLIAQESGVAVLRDLWLIDALVVEMTPARARIVEAKLKNNPHVLRVDNDPYIKWIESAATFADLPLPDLSSFMREMPKLSKPPRRRPPTPPPSDKQQTPWGVSGPNSVNAVAAWPVTRGQGVKLVVIDTGIDYDHPDLKTNIAGGWNAITKTDDFKDDHGHGTHCSGTIAALDNDKSVVGVAPKVSLYGVKVLDAQGSGTFDDVIAGMQWAVEKKMDVASMSLGADQGNDSLKAAVEAMAKAGVVLIAAAGNSGAAVGYPAAYPGAIAIAASDKKGSVAYFSSRGPQVALIAPGVDVLSLAPGTGTATMSGTSMATPHVAGLAALAIAAKSLKGVDAVRGALTAAATPLKDAPVEQQGAGLVNAAKLVQ